MRRERLAQMMERVGDFSLSVRRRRGLISHTHGDPTYAQQYILAAHRELSDLLDSIPGWKLHRAERLLRPQSLDAMVEQSVDVMNYVMAVLTLFNIDDDDLFEVWEDKMAVLEQHWQQEVTNPLKRGEPVWMVDLDGVIADFRTGLIQYLVAEGEVPEGTADPEGHYHLDLDFGLEPGRYRSLKNDFEAGGGYRDLPAFADIEQGIELLRRHARVVFLTSRPKELLRVTRDTHYWLRQRGLLDDRSSIIFEGRKAEWLANTKVFVVGCFEDAPDQIKRLSAQGYKVFVPVRGYNENLQLNERIHRHGSFLDLARNAVDGLTLVGEDHDGDRSEAG